MTDNIIATSKDGRLRVRLEQDEAAENPREVTEVITRVITLPNQKYIDVEPQPEGPDPLRDGWDRLTEADYDTDRQIEIFTRWATAFHGAVVVEHKPYNGAHSLWYLDRAGLSEVNCDPVEYINDDITEYQAWAENDTWGYVVERLNGVGETAEESVETDSWVEVDSSGPFYGYEFAEQAARTSFGQVVARQSEPITGDWFWYVGSKGGRGVTEGKLVAKQAAYPANRAYRDEIGCVEIVFRRGTVKLYQPASEELVEQIRRTNRLFIEANAALGVAVTKALTEAGLLMAKWMQSGGDGVHVITTGSRVSVCWWHSTEKHVVTHAGIWEDVHRDRVRAVLERFGPVSEEPGFLHVSADRNKLKES